MTYYSLGYTKDAIAVIGFIGAFILVYRTRDLQKVKSIILTSLLFAINFEVPTTFNLCLVLGPSVE